jgi:Spy/CpxP family protein refolding chaperone
MGQTVSDRFTRNQNMSRRLAFKRPIMVLALFLLAALTAPAMAQQQPAPGGGGQGGPGGFGGGRMDPAQFRQMMNDRMKELMGANDEEWKALQPRIEKIQQLSRDASNFGGMGLLMDFGQGGGGGRGRGFGGPGGPGGDRQPSAAQQKNTELVEVVKNKTSSPEQLKEKLAAAKAARAQAKAELAKAQEELRELLTVRQEAVLTAIGTLD